MTYDDHSIPRFFVLTFAITWGLQLPAVLGQFGVLPEAPSFYLPLAGLGILGPLLAATILTARDGGYAAVKRLYAPLLDWKVHPLWYVVGLLVPGVVLSAFLLLLNMAGREGPAAYVPALTGVVVAVVVSLGEEVGWRGYALPRLQRRDGPFLASVLLGVLWYLWHIPMFLVSAIPLDLVFVMVLYFVGGSLLFTGIYNGTRGSLLLAVLAHVGAHCNNSHLALPEDVVPLVVHAIVYAGLGLLVMRKVQLFPSLHRARPTSRC